jgi:uncharacterized protein
MDQTERSSSTQAVPKPDAFFFQGATGRRFGVLHSVACRARTGVVCCYPLGEEHLQGHRTYVRLSLLLAERGFPSLRFDYGGCGDSEGELETARLSEWLEDIAAAVWEFQQRTRVEEVVLLGLRLGGSLALRASLKLRSTCGVVVWEPVGSGRHYLARSLSEYAQWLSGSFAVATPSPDGIVDLRGFPLGRSMISELEALDDLEVRREARPLALKRALIIGSCPDALAHTLENQGVDVQTLETSGSAPWDKERSSARGLATIRCMRRISAWMEANRG